MAIAWRYIIDRIHEDQVWGLKNQNNHIALTSQDCRKQVSSPQNPIRHKDWGPLHHSIHKRQPAFYLKSPTMQNHISFSKAPLDEKSQTASSASISRVKQEPNTMNDGFPVKIPYDGIPRMNRWGEAWLFMQKFVENKVFIIDLVADIIRKIWSCTEKNGALGDGTVVTAPG